MDGRLTGGTTRARSSGGRALISCEPGATKSPWKRRSGCGSVCIREQKRFGARCRTGEFRIRETGVDLNAEPLSGQKGF